MGEVTALPGVGLENHGEPNHHLIRMLEEMLVRARSGQLRAVGVAGVLSDRDIFTGYVTEKGTPIYSLYGAMCHTAARIERELCEKGG